MWAIGITEWGPPNVLHPVELPDPEAGPGEIRIRVHAAAVNPTDTQLRSGERADRLKDIAPPHVPGMDAAGVVEQIGTGVTTDLTAGDPVVAIVLPLGSRGAYAERIVVPAESVVPAPTGFGHAESCTLPMNAMTARLALDELSLRPGQTLAVTGAAGAVGGYVLQLAKAMGVQVIADAGPGDEDLVRSLGADVLVERGDDFARQVRAVAPSGSDGLVDAALLGASAVAAVRDGGTVITLRGYDGAGSDGRDIRFAPVYVRTYAKEHAKLNELRSLVETGALSLRVARVFPAAEAPEAHRLLEAGGVRGRLVLAH
jgi:NADPH:quinone reductase-like Zn-dependent oxidoreductase